jgi:hypothetical protein
VQGRQQVQGPGQRQVQKAAPGKAQSLHLWQGPLLWAALLGVVLQVLILPLYFHWALLYC